MSPGGQEGARVSGVYGFFDSLQWTPRSGTAMPPGQGQRAPGVWNVPLGCEGCGSFPEGSGGSSARLPARGFPGATAPGRRGRESTQVRLPGKPWPHPRRAPPPALPLRAQIPLRPTPEGESTLGEPGALVGRVKICPVLQHCSSRVLIKNTSCTRQTDPNLKAKLNHKPCVILGGNFISLCDGAITLP